MINSNELTFEEKKHNLNQIMEELTTSPLAIAFSGGVDSSLLLALAAANEKQTLLAITANTQLHPACDLENASRIANDYQTQHIVITMDEFGCADIQDNPVDRCYRCKRFIMQTMLQTAKEQGIEKLIEGSNIDDTKVYRPGLKAVKELGIISPLMLANFTKEDVRRYAKELGVQSASRPSTPCLATRFPYGTHLTKEKLMLVEQGEEYLKSFGFLNVRLRVHEDIARIEVDANEFEKLILCRNEIIAKLKEMGFTYITLDLEAFASGSMDKNIMTSFL